MRYASAPSMRAVGCGLIMAICAVLVWALEPLGSIGCAALILLFVAAAFGIGEDEKTAA